MPTKSLGKLRSQEEVAEFLSSAGIEPDLRQQGFPLVFATFAIQDHGYGQSLPQTTSKLKDHFITHAPSMKYSSALDGITFNPVLSEMLPPSPKTRVSHRRSSKGVSIRVHLHTATWLEGSASERRRLLVTPLVAALSKIRPAWLSKEDLASLSELLLSFSTRARPATTARVAGEA